ncbi:MAG TPA: TIGR02587 family membrane protein [Acidimicrobiales bacterium]|nr:TIGR02587 family membrane protein [Acidimicrobiales bacterium]
MLFGIPLIYTMEVWWVGSSTAPLRLFAILGLTFSLVVLLNRTSGFRSTSDVRTSDALMDSIEALAVAIVSVTAILVLLREITTTTPLAEALGKIAYEATPFAIGIGLASHFLRRGRAEGDDSDGGSAHGSGHSINPTLADIGATLVGALFIGFNIAPTDEVPMITAAMGPVWIIALIGASLVISYCIVFVAGFSNSEQRQSQAGILQHPVTETVVAYLLSLAAAALMLWFFQRFHSGEPWDVRLSRVIVLGLPAAVGGAAGRLAV